MSRGEASAFPWLLHQIIQRLLAIARRRSYYGAGNGLRRS
jgi:hypothetical protein